jgi:hypothetical protein
VVGGHVALQIELVEKLRLGLLNAHHRPILPISINRVNQRTCRTATRSFSTPSAENGPSLHQVSRSAFPT